MPGAVPDYIVVEAILIMAGKFLVLISPILAIAATWWLVNQTDRVVRYLFPHTEWERELGWLNIRAERRANTALRWCGYAVYLVLLGALLGIVWAAEGLQHLDNWSDPWVMGDLALRVPALGFCLGIWLLYLGCYLIPKLRAQREEAEFQKFRAKLEEEEKEKERKGEMEPRSRIYKPLQKPRTNTPLEMQVPLAPLRMKRKRPPGE